jgi:hypothetical protein
MTDHDYCAKIKSLADALGDVGVTVSEETLVLTVLGGLNEQFSHLRSFLPFQSPFPTFLQTRSALVLEEAKKKTDVKNATASALWASGNIIQPPPAGRDGGSGSTDPRPPSSCQPGLFINIGRGGGTGGRCGRGGCHGHGCENNLPWMFNSWTGLPTRGAQQHKQNHLTPLEPRWHAPL